MQVSKVKTYKYLKTGKQLYTLRDQLNSEKNQNQ